MECAAAAQLGEERKRIYVTAATSAVCMYMNVNVTFILKLKVL